MGSEQQFCLRWNNHQSNLLSVFDNLLQNETLVDVTLACDGLSLKAHKVVLSACSPYFQHLFMDNPCKHPIVILKDIGYTDMKTLIDFMYKGEVNVSHDQLSTLLRVADTLKVKGLAEVTENMAARECDPVSRRQTEGSVPEAKHKSSFSRVGKSTGNLSPPPKRRKKRRSSGGSAGHSDDVDSHGPKDASSRSSTPVEIPIVPKSEVVDMSYDGPDKTLCSVTEDSLPLMNATNSSQHVSMAHEAAIMPHPLSNKDSTEVSQKFELPGEELDTDMPFTQHLAVGSDGTPPSPGAHPSTSSSSHVDQSSYFPPSSSLNLANVASASCPSTSRSASTQAQQRMLRINTKERSSAKNLHQTLALPGNVSLEEIIEQKCLENEREMLEEQGTSYPVESYQVHNQEYHPQYLPVFGNQGAEGPSVYPIGLPTTMEFGEDRNGKTHLGNNVWIDSRRWQNLLQSRKDSLFVKDLAVAIWGTKTLQNKSIHGKLSPRFTTREPRPPLSPHKYCALQDAFMYFLDQKEISDNEKEKRSKHMNTYVSSKISDINKAARRNSNLL